MVMVVAIYFLRALAVAAALLLLSLAGVGCDADTLDKAAGVYAVVLGVMAIIAVISAMRPPGAGR